MINKGVTNSTSYLISILGVSIIIFSLYTFSNTLDESKGTSKYIARMIAEYLNGKS